MAEFKGGILRYELPNASLRELAEVLENLASLSVYHDGPDDQPSSVSYDVETSAFTVEF